MSHPALVRSRLQPIRRLRPEECERLEYEGPLILARRERRFLFGPWRPGKDLLVATHVDASGAQRVLMVCSAADLRARGVEPGV